MKFLIEYIREGHERLTHRTVIEAPTRLDAAKTVLCWFDTVDVLAVEPVRECVLDMTLPGDNYTIIQMAVAVEARRVLEMTLPDDNYTFNF